MGKIHAFFRAFAQRVRRKRGEPSVAAWAVPRPDPPPNGPMTEAQLQRMMALKGTPTEEIVQNIARLRRLTIDETLAGIEETQRPDYKRIVM